MSRSVTRMIFLVFSSAVMFGLAGAEPGKTNAPKQDSAEKDYKSELPRIPPKEPREALKTFKLQPGFHIELVAAEPLLRDPVAIDFDENGRMFVVELPEYNQYANKAFKGHGVIRLLEDIDGDGRYEKSSVYVDKLNYPTAVACWDGGVFVGAAPDLLYCKDTNGDGRADLRTIVYTGFGTDRSGEAQLNSFRWMFDNRFHVSTGLDGGNITAAGKPKAKPLSVKTRQFLFDPRSRQIDWTSGGGQHGMSLDDWGCTFVCSNSNPMQMLMYDGRYLARNPYLQAPVAATNIALDGKYTKIFRISRIEPWRIVRTRLRAKGIVKGPVEGGGTPAGYFSAATGVTVYRGDAWPEEYRGDVFVGEVASNMIFRAKLERKGLSVIAHRADADVEFLASTDNWFRPVQLAHGPDGTMYVIDMYRELIEGAAFLPPQVLEHMNVAGGLKRGRIYRIVPEKFKRPKSPKLGRRTTAELVTLLEHTNGWHRDTASRLLYERQDKSVVPLLHKLVAESSQAQGRMHALYALDGLGSLAASDLLIALGDSHPRVREHAVRLSEKLAEKSPAVRAKLYELSKDPDLRIRYQLAFSLGAFTGEARNTQLAKIVLHDRANSWVRLAVLSSLSDGAGAVFGRVIADAEFRKTTHGRAFLSTLASHIGSSGRRNDIAAVVKSFDQLQGGENSLTQEIVRSLVAKQSGAARKRLSDTAGGKAGSILAEMIAEARRVAPDTKRKLSERVEAVRTLGMSDFRDVADLFDELLKLSQPQPVQSAVLDTLAKFQSPQVASLLLDAWPGLSPTLRRRASETLFSRPAWITALLDALETKRVSRGEISAARVKLLQSYPDKKIRARAAKLFAGTELARRQEVVADYYKSLTLTGDRARGKMHFTKVCSTCHRLEGVGTTVGEDLAAIRNRGDEAILLNILDPNREVKPQYLNYIVVTNEGRALTGMIAAETANGITLRSPDGKTEQVLRINIEQMRSTGLSFMPEGLEKQLDRQAMADLLAYLNSIR